MRNRGEKEKRARIQADNKDRQNKMKENSWDGYVLVELDASDCLLMEFQCFVRRRRKIKIKPYDAMKEEKERK